MIIVMRHGATKQEIDDVTEKVKKLGYEPHLMAGVEKTIIAAVGDERGKARLQSLESMHGVEDVVPILKPYKLASREVKTENTVITVKGVKIGGEKIVVIAGPCSVESREQLMETARAVKEAGADILRGGAFKPRTSPYDFQGLEEEGLKLLSEARDATGLPIITEVMNPMDVDLIAKYSDILQVGARNVQNFALLKHLGQVKKPILLKRGMMTTIKEFLMSAEYILSEGNKEVILCERGIRTFETATRNTLDLGCIPVLRKETHLPIIVDPSHAVGHWEFVAPMAKAAIAAGADGLMIEVHSCPEEAYSDGPQSLKPKKFAKLMEELKPFIKAAGRK
ncbi:MAG: 3-deoxy-7-phosphoheptulonate synthase [Nitrospinae bacterium]|nr:3-deoxy-7-phosphoheptulonate synthase [Nitrospinota bacterium]